MSEDAEDGRVRVRSDKVEGEGKEWWAIPVLIIT